MLSSNAVQKGTQALGVVHAEQKKVTTEFDALILAGGVKVVLKHILELNFGEAALFSFSFDTNTETEEEKQIAVFKGLYDIGVEVPIEHLEKTFKIDGLTRREMNLANSTTAPLEKSEKTGEIKPKYLTRLDKDIDKKDFKPIEKGIKEFVNDILATSETYEDALQSIYEKGGEFDYEELENELANAITNSSVLGY